MQDAEAIHNPLLIHRRFPSSHPLGKAHLRDKHSVSEVNLDRPGSALRARTRWLSVSRIEAADPGSSTVKGVATEIT